MNHKTVLDMHHILCYRALACTGALVCTISCVAGLGVAACVFCVTVVTAWCGPCFAFGFSSGRVSYYGFGPSVCFVLRLGTRAVLRVTASGRAVLRVTAWYTGRVTCYDFCGSLVLHVLRVTGLGVRNTVRGKRSLHVGKRL